MTEIINEIGRVWHKVSVSIREVSERRHTLQVSHGGRLSLCVKCQMKTGKFVYRGFSYCFEHCQCPECLYG